MALECIYRCVDCFTLIAYLYLFVLLCSFLVFWNFVLTTAESRAKVLPLIISYLSPDLASPLLMFYCVLLYSNYLWVFCVWSLYCNAVRSGLFLGVCFTVKLL